MKGPGLFEEIQTSRNLVCRSGNKIKASLARIELQKPIHIKLKVWTSIYSQLEVFAIGGYWVRSVMLS